MRSKNALVPEWGHETEVTAGTSSLKHTVTRVGCLMAPATEIERQSTRALAVDTEKKVKM